MTAKIETAPDGAPELLRKSVHWDKLNNSEDRNKCLGFQALKDLDAAIEASRDCERAAARQLLVYRKATMNLVIYRDQFEAFGEAVWRGAL